MSHSICLLFTPRPRRPRLEKVPRRATSKHSSRVQSDRRNILKGLDGRPRPAHAWPGSEMPRLGAVVLGLRVCPGRVDFGRASLPASRNLRAWAARREPRSPTSGTGSEGPTRPCSGFAERTTRVIEFQSVTRHARTFERAGKASRYALLNSTSGIGHLAFVIRHLPSGIQNEQAASEDSAKCHFFCRLYTQTRNAVPDFVVNSVGRSWPGRAKASFSVSPFSS